MKNEQAVLTIMDLCEVLRISRPTAYQLLRRADFPVLQIGRRRLIPREGLEQWIKAQTDHTGETGMDLQKY